MEAIKSQVHARIIRRDGHSLEHGKVVEYRLDPFPFRVLISRDGIQIQGTSPVFTQQTFPALNEVLTRAKIQYEHLSSFPVGTLQTDLDEDTLRTRNIFNGPRLVPSS